LLYDILCIMQNKMVVVVAVLRSLLLIDRWVKLDSVCFGTKNNQYGSFNVPYGGKIAVLTLHHLSGYVSYQTGYITHWSFWGCGNHNVLKNHVNVVITTSSNHAILPLSQVFTHGDGKWAELPGFNSLSPEIVLPFFTAYSVNSGQEFRVWYGEDLVDFYEADNDGRVCSEVYALCL